MIFFRRFKLGENTQVFLGVFTGLGLCALPLTFSTMHKVSSYAVDTRRGHDVFSSEKPEAIERAEDEKRRQHYT